MAFVSAGHIVLTPTQPLGSGDRSHELLTRNRALCQLSCRIRPPPPPPPFFSLPFLCQYIRVFHFSLRLHFVTELSRSKSLSFPQASENTIHPHHPSSTMNLPKTLFLDSLQRYEILIEKIVFSKVYREAEFSCSV